MHFYYNKVDCTYLNKKFVIGLIENEIERDLRQRTDMSEAPTNSEEVGGQLEGKDNVAVMDDFDSENEDVDEEQDEFEEMGMSMGL